MAKYRITSIPQYAPGGETDRSKRKKKTYEDQPMVEVQGVDQPSYWNQMSSDVVQGIECPPGRENFEGNCLTEDEILSILEARNTEMTQKNFDRRLAKLNKSYSTFENPELASKMLGDYIYNKNRREQEDKDKYQSYISGIQKAVDKGNKYKKETLKPYYSLSKEQVESNPNFEAWYNNTEDPDRANYYVQKKDLGDGNYQMDIYPKEGLAYMMSQAGMKPGEFEKHHGLNAQQLQTEFGDYLGALDKFHIKQGAEMINNLTKQGYSAEDAKRQLVKTGYNSKQGVTQFTGIANDLDFQNNADNYFVDYSGVLYKKDKYGNVYKYTNEYANDDFSLIKGTETKESESPFSKDKESGKEYINPFNWEKVDSKKVKTDAQGNINVNGKNTTYYGYGFGNRAGDKNEANILSQYKSDTNKYYTDTEKQIKDSEVDQQQERYTEMNNMLYDAVYNNTGTKIAPITPVYGVHNDYANEFNKAAQQINSIEGNSQDDVAKRAKILNDFFTKAKTFNSSYIAKVPKEYNADGSVKSYHDKKLDVSQLGNYGDKASVVYLDYKGTRNAEAYKNSGDLKKAMGDARNNAAEELLRYAYTNKINPGSESLNYKGYDGSKYTGEEEYETLPFDVWKQTPEAQEFIANYNKDPKYGEKIYDVEKNRAEKKWQDYQDENSLWKKPTLSNFLEKAGQQISSLANQPVYTLNQWASGNAADPMIGLMPDAPTSRNIGAWEANLGPGGSRLFLDRYNNLNSDFGTQIANLFNPAHFASNVGFGLRNLYEGDPEQEVGDVLLNTAFSVLPVSKVLRAASATKLLPGVKTLSKVGARGLAKNALYNATRNLVTPGAGLTGLFVKDAFMPTGEIDPYTGRKIQGFGVEAGQNIWNEIQKAKEKAHISSSLPSSSSLDFLAHLDSDKVKENLFGLGMAGMIGLHGGKTALGFGKDLLRGAPNYLPAGTRLLNDKYNFEMDPALFNQQYFNRSGLNATGLNPKEPLRLRKEGGDLPQAKMGWPPGSFRLRRKTPTVFGRDVYRPSSTIFNTGIKAGNVFTPTERISTYGNVKREYPINFEGIPYDKNKLGEAIYNVDPLDYGNAANWQQQGILDFLDYQTKETKTNFPELEKNVNNVKGSDISIDLNKLGDFRFQDFSDGWEARRFMMNAFDGPQKTLSKSDFWTDADLNKSVELGKQFDEHQNEFMDFLSVDDVPGFIKKYPHLAEIFTDEFKFPKGKFYSNQAQRKLINDTLGFGYTMIDPLGTGALSALAKGKPFPKTVGEYYSSFKASVLGEPDIKFDSLFPSAQKFNAFDKDWLRRQNPFTYIESLRGLPWADDIINKSISNTLSRTVYGLSRVEAQALQDALIEKRHQMFKQDLMKDINKGKPFKGRDAWNQITSQPGWKNKNGGIAMKLTKKEIDKYVQGGYIVEEE